MSTMATAERWRTGPRARPSILSRQCARRRRAHANTVTFSSRRIAIELPARRCRAFPKTSLAASCTRCQPTWTSARIRNTGTLTRPHRGPIRTEIRPFRSLHPERLEMSEVCLRTCVHRPVTDAIHQISAQSLSRTGNGSAGSPSQLLVLPLRIGLTCGLSGGVRAAVRCALEHLVRCRSH